jgi:hypothetical protein
LLVFRLLSVRPAACSLQAACLAIAYSLLVFCLSGFLPACQRLLVWKLVIRWLFVYCLLSACSLEAAYLGLLIDCLFIVCLAGFLLVGGCLSGNSSFIVCLAGRLTVGCCLSGTCILPSFIAHLAGCLLVGGCIWKLPIVFLLSAWLPARRRLLV